jgi:hypothetical protein
MVASDSLVATGMSAASWQQCSMAPLARCGALPRTFCRLTGSRLRSRNVRSLFRVLALLGCALCSVGSASAAAASLPTQFRGQITATWTQNHPAYICNSNPCSNASFIDEVSGTKSVLTFSSLTFKQTSPGQYKLVRWQENISGSAHHSVIDNIDRGQPTCEYDDTYSFDKTHPPRIFSAPGEPGLLNFNSSHRPPIGTVELSVPTVVTHSHFSGQCNSVNEPQANPEYAQERYANYGFGTLYDPPTKTLPEKDAWSNQYGYWRTSGKLEGGLELRMIEPDGKAVDITDIKVPVAIGQTIELEVVGPSGKPAPKPIKWSVEGWESQLKSTSAIDNYVISSSTGTVSLLSDPASHNDPALTLRFIRSGLHDVTVESGKDSVSARFRVERPTANTRSPATFCELDANNTVSGTTPNGGEIHPPTLGLGVNDSCGPQFGVIWHWQVNESSGTTGQLAMVQLITRLVTRSDLGHPCVDVHVRSADTHSFYPDVHGSTTTTHAQLLARDAPFIPLRHHNASYTSNFKAWDYLMYRHSAHDIWVPIAELIWNFSGSAKFRGLSFKNPWEAFDVHNPMPHYAGTVIGPLPQWKQAVASSSDSC